MSGSAERRNRCREANSAHRNILELSTRTLSRACPGHPWLRLTDDLHGCRLTGSYAAHRQGQLFAKAGHATRRAHDAAGSNGGAEAAANELGFGCVDVAGAVLRPEATAIGAGAEDFAFVVADEHGAGSGASTSKFAGSPQSTWGFDIRGRQTPAVS
jgi:hypothetical protein